MRFNKLTEIVLPLEERNSLKLSRHGAEGRREQQIQNVVNKLDFRIYF